MKRRIAFAAMALCATSCQAGTVTCTGTIGALAFGTVDPRSSQTDAAATINYTCTNSGSSASHVAACLQIGAGPDDAPNADPRQMMAGTAQYLQFQIYQDAARTVPWGSSTGTIGTPRLVQVLVPAMGNASGSATVYGRVLAGQPTAFPGLYSEVASSNAIAVADGGATYPANCNGGTTVGSSLSALKPSAFVSSYCTVTATTLSFGSVGLLTAPTTATSELDVTCANGGLYVIGLGAGLHAGGDVNARAMSSGTDAIAYQLYSDASMTTVWASSLGSSTAYGTGNGGLQKWTVYGRVPVQATPSPGAYGDTVTVSVYY